MGFVRDHSRFIFVEGIMGSGKTTNGEWLAGQLRQWGIAARFLEEGPTTSRPEHPLRVSASLAHPLAVWRDVTVDDYIERSIIKWEEFVRETHRKAVVTVCDGLLFHGNMTDLLLMNAPPTVLRGYVARVLGTLRELNPVVLYHRPPDIAQALRAVCDERGRAWESYQVEWKVNSSPYGVARGLRGFAGLTTLYLDYCAVCDGIVANQAIPTLTLHRSGGLVADRRAIIAFLFAPVSVGSTRTTINEM